MYFIYSSIDTQKYRADPAWAALSDELILGGGVAHVLVVVGFGRSLSFRNVAGTEYFWVELSAHRTFGSHRH
jgi:hypothetical protein